MRESLKLNVAPNSSRTKRVVTTTPFNCHHDLPLMVNKRYEFQKSDDNFDLTQTLEAIRVDGLSLRALEAKRLSVGGTLYSIELYSNAESSGVFAEFTKRPIVFVCSKQTRAAFLHCLFDALLAASDAEVDESFSFDGFNRFSRGVCPSEIGKFSFETRNLDLSVSDANREFLHSFEDMSYRVDSSKAPRFNSGKLGAMQRTFLRAIEARAGRLEGYLPKEPEIKIL